MIQKIVRSPWLFFLIFIFYFIGSWGMSVPLTGDQKVYLSIALEMRKLQSWLIPYLFSEPNFLKPPFQYWMTLIGWKAFGFSILGAVLPSMIALLASAFFTKKIARHFDFKNPQLAALLFVSSIGALTYGTTAQMEIWVVLFYLAAWFFALKEKLFLSLLVVGLMSMIKGPLYSVLWVPSYVVYLFFQKRQRELIRPRFIFALLVGMAVGLAWYFLAALTHREELMQMFFQRETLGKMGGNHSSPFVLWGEFFYSLFPWCFLFLFSLFSSSTSSSRAFLFYLAYSLLPAIFFTVFPYRVNTYLFLLTPIAAMMVSEFDFKKYKKVLFGISGVITVAAIILLARLYQGEWVSIQLATPLAIVLIVWSISHLRANVGEIAILSLCLVSLVRVAAVELGERDLLDLRAYIDAKAPPLIGFYLEQKDIWHEFGIISVATRVRMERVFSIDEVSLLLKQGGTIIFTDEQKQFQAALECEKWSRLKKRIKFPFFELLTQGVSYQDARFKREFALCRTKSLN